MNKKKNDQNNQVWSGIDDSHFEDESNIEDRDIGEYNKEKMSIFALNVNCARQLPALEDSLKPVERRVLYVMYLMDAYGGKKRKSAEILGATMKLHPHGDASIYNTMVGLAQSFKKGQKLIRGIGNFGNIMNPDSYAHYRYTEVTLSDYAYECFFDEYDPDCIEMEQSATMDSFEPVFLPGKFPNILVNGSTSIAYGFNCVIPPYNIEDIIKITKQLITDPNDRKFVIYPDIPTGCDIVDEGKYEETCMTGRGTMHMRSHIEIEDVGNSWMLRISSIPWQSNLDSIQKTIGALAKSGEIPIKDAMDSSYAVMVPGSKYKEIANVIDYKIFIDKAYDPIAVRNKLYKKAGLDKTIPINFQVVHNGLSVKSCGIADILLAWVDSRREYLRRLYNKKNARISARINLLDILIELTEGKNLEKTVKIVRSSEASALEERLVSVYGMNSFQAKKIADMGLRSFTEDAHTRYVDERNQLAINRDNILKIARSEKEIDKIIISGLDSLRKYGTDRKSKIVKDADVMQEISDTNHILVITKKGYIKKLPEVSHSRTKGYGVFSAGDYPIIRVFANNMDKLCFFDSLGKYSVVPVNEFENTTQKDPGERVFRATRLDGEIVSVFPAITDEDVTYVQNTMHEDVALVTITKNGLIKKTAIQDLNSYKVLKGVRGLRLKPNDSLACAVTLLGSRDLLIYTKLGNYSIIRNSEIPLTARESVGVQSVDLAPGDEVRGYAILEKTATHLCVLTEKGSIKKVPMDAIEIIGIKKRKDTSYLTYLQNDDSVFQCAFINPKSNVYICNKSAYKALSFDEIPEMSRRSKGSKMIPVPVGDNIITMIISDKSLTF